MSNPTLYRGMSGEHVKLAQKLLLSQGYFIGIPKGNFRQLTEEATFNFQAQHIDPLTKKWLEVDGIIGPATWRALLNPSGSKQRSYIKPIDIGLFTQGHEPTLAKRQSVLDWFLGEYRKGVKEVPDGSNWGPRVKDYLINCGLGPNPWCMAFGGTGYEEATGEFPFVRTAHVMTWKNAAAASGCYFPKSRYSPIPGDAGIMSYGNGSGHIFLITGVSSDSYHFNTIGGNEGNRVKYGLRNKSSKSFIGFVNIFGDSGHTKFTHGVSVAGSVPTSLKDTR